MYADIHGLPISTASAEAGAAFDRTVLAYLKYRADLPARFAETLVADADSVPSATSTSLAAATHSRTC